MKIIIVTPLWPPELGGPANYAKNLAREFKKAGHRVCVLSFSRKAMQADQEELGTVSFISLKYPSGLRHFLFFCKLLPKLYKTDLCFALDPFSVGFPASMACFILRRPLILRLEGDFLWESFVERTRKDTTLREFYQRPQPLSLKEKFIKKITGWVMKKANILAFSSEWRRDMVVKSFNIPLDRTFIIRNVWSATSLPILDRSDRSKIGQFSDKKTIFWAGRMLYLKNLHRLIRVFARVNDGSYELCLAGEGLEKESLKSQVKMLKLEDKVKFIDPLPGDELLKLYRQAAFFVLPSLSDVGPNVIADAMATKTPFIMTRESGYAEHIRDFGLLVDPLDEDNLAAKIRILMDEQKRKEYKERLESFNSYRDWKEAARDWLGLFLRQNHAL